MEHVYAVKGARARIFDAAMVWSEIPLTGVDVKFVWQTNGIHMEICDMKNSIFI
jgi:hypothetical protein